MPFSEAEVLVGAIAYFSIDDLRGDASLSRTGGTPDRKGRPFVCYAKDADGDVYWTPLTTETTQGKRTPLDKAWIVGAVDRFATDHVLVNDGGHTYKGTPAAFARLSVRHDKYGPATRPRLTQPGVTAVLAAVRARGGQVPSR